MNPELQTLFENYKNIKKAIQIQCRNAEKELQSENISLEKIQGYNRNLNYLEKDKELTEFLIIREILRPDYQDYSEKHDIDYDIDSKNDLFYQCDIHFLSKTV